ncbi:hypothetical protein MAPG_10984 [Magnaporthiopsis poae ATCC 64411]|uniref:Uncharacterized protein n=1 Tax=Magnaporthiopsis poae (strain ATCC 64411 / 73-15) TaxID=644358 RepID=A0A0C4EE19_MAGP6|nr:hypothetical protein MAPG_10984 [Magnaporthiopsis poae ATCC 64411]
MKLTMSWDSVLPKWRRLVDKPPASSPLVPPRAAAGSADSGYISRDPIEKAADDAAATTETSAAHALGNGVPPPAEPQPITPAPHDAPKSNGTGCNAANAPATSLPKGQKKYAIRVNTAQNQVYPFPHAEGIYCALPSKLPLPCFELESWKRWKQVELQYNLDSFRHEVGRKLKPGKATVEMPELRLSGREADGEVYLTPTIWILCGSVACRDKLRRWMRDASWVGSLEYPVEIQFGASVLAGFSWSLERLGDMSFAGPPLMLLDGITGLYAHVEASLGGLPSCGRLVCFTALRDGNVLWRQFSRVGGMINVGSLRYMVTTAHGILERHYNKFPVSQEKVYVDGDDSSIESDSGACDDAMLSDEVTSPLHTGLGYVDPAGTEHWGPIQYKGPINFLGIGNDENGLAPPGARPAMHPGSGTRAPASDFALLGCEQEPFGLDHGAKLLPRFSFKSLRLASADELDTPHPRDFFGGGHTEPTRVLMGRGCTESAFLLPQLSAIHTQGAKLETRKIELDSPMAPGTSGSWVIRDGELLGMVVAVYPHEPFAQILTSEKLVTDIKAAFPFEVDVTPVCDTEPTKAAPPLEVDVAPACNTEPTREVRPPEASTGALGPRGWPADTAASRSSLLQAPHPPSPLGISAHQYEGPSGPDSSREDLALTSRPKDHGDHPLSSFRDDYRAEISDAEKDITTNPGRAPSVCLYSPPRDSLV